MPGPKSGFFAGGIGNWSHESITENAILSLSSAFGFGSPDHISRRALRNIEWQNGQTDLDKREKMLSAPHFVGENFYGANERLKAHKNRIDQLMSPSNPSGVDIADAQYLLGRALHTLQDFYAHSNWVEVHPRPPGPTLPPIWHELGDGNQTIHGPSFNLPTCQDCTRNTCEQCESILLTTQITSAYYGGTTDNPKKPSWKCSHGGRVGIFPDTSGNGFMSAGINKDTQDCIISPFNERHHDAAGAAIRATQEYLTEIRDLIGNSQMQKLLGGGATPRIGFVVDTTGSMGFEIASVQQQILSIIQTRVSLGLATQYFLFPFNDPGFGTITMTTDPNVMSNAVNALTANAGGDCPEPVNAALLRAFGEIPTGGDILMFTDARPSDPTLTFAVGSFARSSGIRLTSVFSGANDTFGCPFLDSRFSTMSFDTGGQFFSLNPSEAGLISHLGHFLAVPNQVDLFSRIGVRSTVDQIFNVPIDSTMPRMILGVTGTGATNIVVRRPDNSIVQPNDPNVSRVAVSTGVIYSILNPAVGNWGITITGTGLGMNHVYTSPVAYEASVAYAQSTAESQENESHGPSASLEPAPAAAPLPAMQGAEEFTIRVAGESTIDVNSFEFLELDQEGAHPGFERLMSNPIAGRTTTVGTTLVTEGASTSSIQLRGLDGTVLQTLNLQELTWPGDNPALPLPRQTHFKDYIGNITVPNVPFQVYVTGTTTGGSQYQRVVPGVFRPQTLEIIADSIPNLHPGQSFTHTIQVKNSGAADTFQLAGTDDLNFLAGIWPSGFTLNTNETKSVKVLINVPANAVPFKTDNVHFSVVGSTSNATKSLGPFMINPVPALRLGTFTVTPIGGDGDAFLDPGEGATVSAQLINDGSSTATNIRVGLGAATAGVEVSQGDSLYADIAPSANGTNLTPFVFYLPPNMECGQTIQLSLNVTSEGNGIASEGQHNFTVSVGQQTNTNATRSFTGPAVSIPDGDPAGVNVPITVSGLTGQVDDLNFRFDGTTCNSTTTVGLNHTWVEDLNATLKSPGGTTVSLFEAVGGNGDNFCNTLLDDQATNLIQNVTAANAPFTGSFKPKSPLNAFRGENPNGVWTLNVTDFVTADGGSVRAFSLLFTNAQFSCNAAPADTTAPSCNPTDFRPGPPASADITTQDTGTGLASVHVTSAQNVNVVVPSFTPGTTAPIIVTGTLIDPNVAGSFAIESVDVAGNVSICERTISVTPPQITFRTNRHGNYELYVMNDDGSNPTRITNTTVNHMGYQWAPNGLKIATVPEQDGSNWWDILVMNPDGSNRLNLTQDLKFSLHFGWSADSSKIAFESDRDGPFALWTVNADGSSMTRLINTGGAEKSPAWAPNGQKIAYLSYINSVNNKPDIWSINPDGSNAVNLTNTAATEGVPVYSPDGTKILFGRRSSTSVPFDIYVMNPDGTGVQFLATGATAADYKWSPDGTKIAFVSSRDGNFEIYVMNANGSNQVRLTNHSALDMGPNWSANGQRIVFSTFRTGNWEVFIMNADGSNQVNLTNNPAIDDGGRYRP